MPLKNRADDREARRHFFKPIKLDEFRHVLETAWRTYRPGQENERHRPALEDAVRRQTRRVRRTFLAALPPERAFDILRAGSGRHFQPEFVRAFLELLRRPPADGPRLDPRAGVADFP